MVEYGTNEPIPNVGVLVHYTVPGNGLSGGRDVPYDSVVSNANGEVFLDGFEHDPGELKIYTRDTSYFDNWPGGGPTYSVTELFKRNPVMELRPISRTLCGFYAFLCEIWVENSRKMRKNKHLSSLSL